MKSKIVFFLFASLFFMAACSQSPNENTTTEQQEIEATNPVTEETNLSDPSSTELGETDKQEEEVVSNNKPTEPSAKPVVNEIKSNNKKAEINQHVEPKEKASAPKEVKEKIVKEEKKVEAPEEEPEMPKPAIDHSSWDQQLRKYVSSTGKVNYAAWKSDIAKLDAYLALLAKEIPSSSWTRNAAMAYWINAYNAYTVKLILNNYPTKSITNLHGGKPWDVKWIKLAGKSYSLNQIENDILRPRYKDARIHFAVNCAALSCPPLMNQAYTESNLNSKLAANTKKFINNSKFNTIDASSAKVSKIFEWYASDFGDLKSYLNKYSNTKLGDGANIGYQEYDWALNGN